MRSTNRNRPDHRSTALGLVILGILTVLLFAAAPAAAENTAYYTVAPNGSVVDADISFTGMDTFYLLMPGFLGEETELTGIKNLTLTNESGAVVTPKNNKGTYTFPSGNYTLQYTAPIADSSLYLRYAAPFNVTVYLSDPYTTGNQILGKPSTGGIVTTDNTTTVVTYTDTKQASIPFYDKNRPLYLGIFIGAWLFIFIICIWRYKALKKRQLDPKKYS